MQHISAVCGTSTGRHGPCVVQVLYDLLSPTPGTPENLQIVDEGGATVMKGLTQVQVSTEEAALALLFEGNNFLHCVPCKIFCHAMLAVCVLLIQLVLPHERNASCTPNILEL